jgi:hypothetical protein
MMLSLRLRAHHHGPSRLLTTGERRGKPRDATCSIVLVPHSPKMNFSDAVVPALAGPPTCTIQASPSKPTRPHNLDIKHRVKLPTKWGPCRPQPYHHSTCTTLCSSVRRGTARQHGTCPVPLLQTSRKGGRLLTCTLVLTTVNASVPV